MSAPMFRRLCRDGRGLTTVEYVIAVCLVGAMGVGMWKSFGDNIRSSGAKANTLLRDYLRVEPSKSPPSAGSVR